MKTPRILIFGSPEDLATPFVDRLRTHAGVEWVVRDHVPPPAKGALGDYDGAIFVWKSAAREHLAGWKAWFAALPKPVKIAAIADGDLPVALRSEFMPVLTISASQDPSEILKSFGAATAAPADDLLSEFSLSVNDPSAAVELPAASSSATVSPDAFGDLGSFYEAGAAPSPTPSEDAKESLSPFETPLDLEGEAPSIKIDSLDEEPVSLDATPVAQATSVGLKLETAVDSLRIDPVASADAEQLWSEAATPEIAPAAAEAPPSLDMAATTEGLLSSADEPVAASALPSDVFGATTPTTPSDDDAVAGAVADSSVFSMGGTRGGDDLKTLQRYAALKERESREKEAALRALGRQLDQIRDRLSKSEGERRRLQMEVHEGDSRRRAAEDERDQLKHHLAKLEATHQEELREFQLRLDSVQYQANRAEKKLEDFRERVRTDIQKIRSRERELTNRLELQKRDAEALLSAKDERLLQQKREIDRADFEIDQLRERLLEQTQKAEDRVSRLSRASKALKMAQGMLSSIDDEVLPSVAGGGGNGGGEEAA